MRKLLLGTTALAAAVSFSANALADVSISGYYEWRYESRSSKVTAYDGTTFNTDSEVKMTFSNKTDSGLDVSMKTELLNDSGDARVQESAITIAGGFGKLILGDDDGVNDAGLTVAANDLIGEEMYYTSGAGTAGSDHSLGIKNGDMANLAGDSPKIVYILPSMGGLTAGVSHTNASAAGNADTTQYALKYSMSAGGASVTIAGASGTTEVANAQDIDSQVMGVSVSAGNISATVSQAEYESATNNEEGTAAAVSFKVSDNMKIGIFTSEVEDSLSSFTTKEEYTNTGGEINYTIAPGLNAIINVEDYDYKAGSATGTNDSGTVSKLTIKATF